MSAPSPPLPAPPSAISSSPPRFQSGDDVDPFREERSGLIREVGCQAIWSLSSCKPDVSIWLHQAVKGLRDKDGNQLPNAHLLSVFHRICKLLNYGIKPVFVFDGGVPTLKRQTMNVRRQKKLEAKDKSDATRTKLLTNLVRQQVQKQTMKALPPTHQLEKIMASLSPQKKSLSRSPVKRKREPDSDDEDEFAKLRKKLEENDSLNNSFVSSLFSTDKSSQASSDSSDSEDQIDYGGGRNYSDHFSSITSPNFDSLPLELQHEILFDMQESKKTNSWGKMHEMPKDLQNFSSFQMDRLVKRRFLQKKIQTVQKEMGERHIHVQNLDDLAHFEAEFDSATSKEIIGSKDKGALLIKAINSVPKPGTSKSVRNTNGEPEVITIDDYVEEWDDSDDDVKCDIGKINSISPRISETQESSSSQNKISEEEAELQLAIAMSLQECEENSEAQAERPNSDLPVEIRPNSEKAAGKTSTEYSAQFGEQSPTKLRSSIKETENTIIEVSKSQPSHFVLPTEFQKSGNSCFKFLGRVGFNENVPVPQTPIPAPTISVLSSSEAVSDAKKVESVHDIDSSSSDCSDFEEVGEVTLEIERPSASPNTDNKNSIDSANMAGHTISELLKNKKSVVPSVPIKLDHGMEFKKDEDIFADIFNDPKLESGDPNANVESRNVEMKTKGVIPIKLGRDLEFKKEEDIFADIFANQNSSETSGIENRNAEVEVTGEAITKSPVREMNVQANEVQSEIIVEDEFDDSDFEDVLAELQAMEDPKSKIISEKPGLTRRTLGAMPSQSQAGVRIISAEFLQAQQKLSDAQAKLQNTRGDQDRIAASITDQMYIEAQELLSLFGIPFVVSPMEAESQCAFLDSACLTDGTITDDSDVWLFGGQRVYRNFFSQGERPVQFFQYADIFQDFNLDREKLVVLAILTGSDYTTGVDGVGPVLALEILTEFREGDLSAFDSLVQFRAWWDSIQGEMNEKPANKIKAKLQKLKLRPGFPSKAVYDAYMEPTIDSSAEPFRWGSPNLDLIKEYTRTKFGWNASKLDSTLGPILKNWNSTENHSGRQTTMDDFVTITGTSTQKINVKSKRLAHAMKKLKRELPAELNLSSDSESESEVKGQGHKSGHIGISRQSSSRMRSGANGKPGRKKLKGDGDESSNLRPVARIPKKVNASIPQKVEAESRNKLLKKQAAELMKKKIK